MISKKSEDFLVNLIIFVEQSRKTLNSFEEFELYQGITSLVNEQGWREDAFHIILNLLVKVQNQRVFAALLSSLIEKLNSKTVALEQQLQSVLFDYIDNPQSKFKKTIMKTFLKEKGSLLQKLIASCRASQTRCETVLSQINSVLVEIMHQSPVTNMNFTHSSLLALKCIEYGEHASQNLIQEALRHLLIVDCIQKGQVVKIILQNDVVLEKLEFLGRRQYVSGFWYYLIGKMYSDESSSNFSSYQKLSTIAQSAYLRAISLIDSGKDLNEQIDKISYSTLPEAQKLNILYQLRGLTFFVSTYILSKIQSDSKQQKSIDIIEKFMQIKDFVCFEYSIRTYLEAIDKQLIGTQLTQAVSKSIQENCLPNYYPSLHEHYDATELEFYSFNFQGKDEINISARASSLMDKTLQRVMDSRGCKHKRKICNCCEEYIHSTIEKQYDHEFHAHEFMSACHLMCREISRVVRVSPEQSQTNNLKEYLITNLKWLLNLNESCLPQYRRCINFKIFDLMISFPPLFRKNQFLQEVVDDLLVSRLPHTLKHLNRLLRFYQSQANVEEESTMINQSSLKALNKLGEKLLKKCGEEVFRLEQKIEMWDIIVGIWEKDEVKLGELLEIYTLHQDHTLAKYIALKKKKIRIAEKVEARALQIQQKMQTHHLFYSQDLSTIRRHLKND